MFHSLFTVVLKEVTFNIALFESIFNSIKLKTLPCWYFIFTRTFKWLGMPRRRVQPQLQLQLRTRSASPSPNPNPIPIPNPTCQRYGVNVTQRNWVRSRRSEGLRPVGFFISQCCCCCCCFWSVSFCRVSHQALPFCWLKLRNPIYFKIYCVSHAQRRTGIEKYQ